MYLSFSRKSFLLSPRSPPNPNIHPTLTNSRLDVPSCSHSSSLLPSLQLQPLRSTPTSAPTPLQSTGLVTLSAFAHVRGNSWHVKKKDIKDLHELIVSICPCSQNGIQWSVTTPMGTKMHAMPSSATRLTSTTTPPAGAVAALTSSTR